jgi:hypothetical protein
VAPLSVSVSLDAETGDAGSLAAAMAGTKRGRRRFRPLMCKKPGPHTRLPAKKV